MSSHASLCEKPYRTDRRFVDEAGYVDNKCQAGTCENKHLPRFALGLLVTQILARNELVFAAVTIQYFAAPKRSFQVL